MSNIDVLLKYIIDNRVSTVEITDALGKSGSLPGIQPLVDGSFSAGRIHYTYVWGGSNWSLHKDIQSVSKGDVVYVDSLDGPFDEAILGDLVCKQLLFYQGVSGVVVNGNVRDVHRILKEKYSVWCKGRNPVGLKNHNPGNIDTPLSGIMQERKNLFDGGILVCDDSGVALITKSDINQGFIEKVISIEKKEDLWYLSLDSLKMNTFEFICKEEYKKHDFNSIKNEE